MTLKTQKRANKKANYCKDPEEGNKIPKKQPDKL